MMIEDFDGDIHGKIRTDGSTPSATPDLPQKSKKPSDIYRKSGIYYDDIDERYERKLSDRFSYKKSPLRKKYGEERKLLKPQKPPLFSQMSSEALKALKDETRVTVLIGSPEKEEMTIYLSAPTKADIKTADATHKMSQGKRQKTLRKAMENKNSWMVAYIMTVWREQDSNLDWIDPNHCFYHEWSSSRTFATVACRDSTVPVAALFLQTDAVNLHNDRGDCGDALWGAIHNEDPEQSHGIIKMLCRYGHLRISDSDIQYAKTQTLRDLLKTEQSKRIAAAPKDTGAEAEAKALPESEKAVTTTAAAEDGSVWKKLDSSSICKLTTDDSGFRLRKIFNFKSGTISESHEYLNADGAVTTATAPTVLRFGAVGSRREIEEAQKRLKALNAPEETSPPPAAKTVQTDKKAKSDAQEEKAEPREKITVYPGVNPRAFM